MVRNHPKERFGGLGMRWQRRKKFSASFWRISCLIFVINCVKQRQSTVSFRTARQAHTKPQRWRNSHFLRRRRRRAAAPKQSCSRLCPSPLPRQQCTPESARSYQRSCDCRLRHAVAPGCSSLAGLRAPTRRGGCFACFACVAPESCSGRAAPAAPAVLVHSPSAAAQPCKPDDCSQCQRRRTRGRVARPCGAGELLVQGARHERVCDGDWPRHLR